MVSEESDSLIKGYLCCLHSFPWFLTYLVLNFSLGTAQACDPLIPVLLPKVFQGSGGLTSPCTSPLSGSSSTPSAITPSAFGCAWQIFRLLKHLLVKKPGPVRFMENPVFQLKLKSWGGASQNRARAWTCRCLCFHPAGWFHHWNTEEWKSQGFYRWKNWGRLVDECEGDVQFVHTDTSV